MKFRKTFDTIEDVRTDYCDRTLCGKCPLLIASSYTASNCTDWVAKNPEKAASLLGVEIIREEPLEVDPATNLVQEAQEEPEQETVGLPNVRRHWNICEELNRLYERKNHDRMTPVEFPPRIEWDDSSSAKDDYHKGYMAGWNMYLAMFESQVVKAKGAKQ